MKKIQKIMIYIFFILLTSFVSFAWSKDFIDKGISNNILSNELAEDPKKNISRQEFCILVYRYIESKNTLDEEKYEDKNLSKLNNPFSDTNNRYVVSSYHLNIVKGKSRTIFAPDDPLTRQEAAVILSNALISMGIKNNVKASIDKFSDKNAMAPWARDGIRIVLSHDLMRGVSENEFSPKTKLTVEQAIVSLLRIDNLLVVEGNKSTFNDGELIIMLNKVNDFRLKNNIPPLKTTRQLNSYAQIRANEIIKNFSHTRPNGSEFYSSLENYQTVAENIAYGYKDVENVMDGWIKSPNHRKNLLNHKHSHIGVAYAISENGNKYWVQIFYSSLDKN